MQHKSFWSLLQCDQFSDLTWDLWVFSNANCSLLLPFLNQPSDWNFNLLYRPSKPCIIHIHGHSPVKCPVKTHSSQR